MIIVLSAPKRSGKDVIADILKKSFGYQRVAFADPLRKICAEMFQLPLIHFTDDTLKDITFNYPVHMHITELDRLIALTNADEIQSQLILQHGRNKQFNTPREILQFVGTDLIRNCIADDYLIQLGLKAIAETEGNIVITDARFPNERAALRAMGGTLIRLKRKGYEGSGHISETSIGDDSEYDVIINNDGTLSQLEHDVKMWHTLRFSR